MSNEKMKIIKSDKEEINDAKQDIPVKEPEGPLVEEKPKMKIFTKVAVANNRTDKRYTYEDKTGCGLVWGFNPDEGMNLVISQLFPKWVKIDDGKGGFKDVQDWINVASLQGFSIIAIEFVEK
jgi:hypothetical protein